jgi:hypothetical protein
MDNGGPAFPHIKAVGHRDYAGGMSIRDWFAAQALQGCLAYSHYNETWGDFHNNGSHLMLAQHCYELADAMLEVRARPPVTSHDGGSR